MPQSSVNIKGQITLPKAYRKKYGINPKDVVTITDTGDALVIRKAKSIFEFKGFAGKAKPQDEEREAAMEGASQHESGDEK